MRWLWGSFLLLASLLPLAAEDWTTEDGKTYRNVTVLGQEDDGVRITYDGGVGKIPYYELPVDVQKRFGQDIESLAEKKRAVDRAIEDAVRSTVEAEQMKQPAQAAVPPINAPTAPVPQAALPNATPSETTPGGAPGPPAPQMVAPNAAPGNYPTAPGGRPNSAAGNVAPNTAAVPAPSAARLGPTESPSSWAEPISHTPAPNGVMGAGGKQLQLSVANYIYNAVMDVCYLDSPPIDLYADPAPKTSLASGQGSSLTLRVVTDGRTPQAPDRFEATFLAVGGDGSDIGQRPIVFNTDTTQVLVDESAKKDSGTLPGGGQAVQYISFYLEPAQAHQIGSAKDVTLNVGVSRYRMDGGGRATLSNYLSDVDNLAPASSSFVRSFYKMLARIPSFFAIISAVCEYVILGSFALLVAASIAAFILGVTRFIKM